MEWGLWPHGRVWGWVALVCEITPSAWGDLWGVFRAWRCASRPATDEHAFSVRTEIARFGESE